MLYYLLLKLLLVASYSTYSESRHDRCDSCNAKNQALVEDCAISIVSSNVRNDILLYEDNSSAFSSTTNYVAPCSGVNGIQESTSALLSARALMKYYNGNSSVAWQLIQSIFDVQGINGFIPKYRYSPLTSSSKQGERNDAYYIPNTKFPYKGFFQKLTNHSEAYASYLPPQQNNQLRRGQLSSSIPLAALPLHSTTILEIFYLSSQTDYDLLQLELYFTKLFQWHSFLYNYRNITSNSNIVGIRHPWESTIPMKSPFWKYAFQLMGYDNHTMTNHNWTVPFSTPNSVKSSNDYPGDDMYNLFLFLFHCNSAQNHTQCFTMVDVGFSSILSKSSRDLLQIAKILNDKRCARTITTQEWDTMYQWVNVPSSDTIEETSWDDLNLSFTSQILLSTTSVSANALPSYTTNTKNYSLNQHGNSDFVASIDATHTVNHFKNTVPETINDEMSNSTTFQSISFPVADNFLVFYGVKVTNTTKVDFMIFHLVQDEGCFSFQIGGKYFPILPVGTTQCSTKMFEYHKNESDSPFISISPTLNYWVSRGLIWNDEHGLGHYIMNSTLKLIFQLPKTSLDIFTDNSTCDDWNNTFAQFYSGLSGEPLLARQDSYDDSTSSCDSKWTETAAIVFEMLRPDKNFTYSSAPPISSGWIFLFMTIELGVTLSVGIGCFLYSFNLRRRLAAESEDGDAFAQLISIKGEDDWYDASLVDLYGEAYNPQTIVQETEHHPGYLTDIFEEQYEKLAQRKNSH